MIIATKPKKGFEGDYINHDRKNKIIEGIAIKKSIPIFKPFPTVKSSLVLLII